MKLEGGCYCGALRYKAEGDPLMQGQCHCRECQYITGGAQNTFLVVPVGSFTYTKGVPKQFKRADLDHGITREFCAECGTHVAAMLPTMPVVVVKAGTLDEPGQFTPQLSMFTVDKQPFHHIPDGLPAFERQPQL